MAEPSGALVWAHHPASNQAEQRLRRQQLINNIEQFVAAYNKTKAPFNWSATADSILETFQRLCTPISRTGQ
jgi:hypothetical protein